MDEAASATAATSFTPTGDVGQYFIKFEEEGEEEMIEEEEVEVVHSTDDEKKDDETDESDEDYDAQGDVVYHNPSYCSLQEVQERGRWLCF